MSKALSVALDAHFGGTVTSVCTCWKITRQDGEVFGFTDHDAVLTIDGLTYEASTGFFRTAIANSATTSVDNLEVRGFLDSETITEAELRNGAYDFAAVEVFAVNWADLSMGICRLRYGHFGEVIIRPSGLFVIELRGLMQLFSQTVGETIQPECRADLGDVRCGVKLVPDLRESGATYAVGDRVLVPLNNDLSAVYLPIQNPDFEWYESTVLNPSAQNLVYPSSEYSGWKLTGCNLSNFPLAPHSGTYYIKPSANIGNVLRAINTGSWGSITRDVTFKYWVKHNEVDWEDSGLIEARTLSGTLVTSNSTAYTSATVGDWVQRTVTLAALNFATVRNIMLYARFRPTGTSTFPAAIQIDDFTVEFSGVAYTTDMTMDNPATSFTTPRWTGGTSRGGNVNLAVYTGERLLRPPTAGNANQTVSMIGIGLINTEIDAGNYKVDLTAWVAAFEWGMQYKISVDFLNAGAAVIGTATTGWVDILVASEWRQGRLLASIPALTRGVKIKLEGETGPMRDGNPASNTLQTVTYDHILGRIIHVDADGEGMVNQFGGLEYEATTGGVASTTVPTFTHVLGEDVTDGTVVWEAVTPEYTFFADIGTVTDNRTFTLPDIDAPDDHFNWGVLKFLSGLNVGRAVEVISWNNTTKQIVLMLPALMTIGTGDTIVVHAGCDKTLSPTGCKKFLNWLNFRGEPNVPGTDEYFKVGGTG